MPNFTRKYCDLHVIPDSHNTGCKGTLTKWYNHPAFTGKTMNATTGALNLDKSILDYVDGFFENIDFDNCVVVLSSAKCAISVVGREVVTF
ncbi:MAG: hypothetical protein MJ236_03725, partial [Clostridia bacterium]|nr:hypothetical protein [Clostridia bacterium]